MNIKRILFGIAFFVPQTLHLLAQDATSIKIDGKDYTTAYQQAAKTANVSVDVFVDTQLKLKEAKALHLDTLTSFRNEYNSYRSVAEKPYLEDTTAVEAIAKEMYDRLGKNLNVSHILLPYASNKRFPADTLKLYNEALKIRARLVGKKAEPFSTVAAQTSGDLSSRNNKDHGCLGWEVALTLDQAFEDAMYAAEVNKVSMPVRSSFGYHLIKVNAVRPDQGLINITELMLGYPSKNPTKEQLGAMKLKIDSIHQQLLAGADFNELCKKYSADKETTKKGSFGWIWLGSKVPQAFKDTAFTLSKIGDISSPVQTEYGYHIIKLLGRRERDSWDESKKGLEMYLSHGDRKYLVQDREMKDLQKILDYKQNKENYASLIAMANTAYPIDSIVWSNMTKDNRTLFSLGSKTFTIKDLSINMRTYGSPLSYLSTDAMQQLYNYFLYTELKAEQKLRADELYPKLKESSKRYADEILLYDVTDSQVWKKAENDTLAIAKYFEANRAKYKFNEPHYKGYVIRCKNEKTLKEVKKISKNNPNTEAIFNQLLVMRKDTTMAVHAESNLWAKGENDVVDNEIFGMKEKSIYPKYPFNYIHGKLLDAPEDYKDVKGQVIADYQRELEKEWLASLRKKYKVEITH